jgi:hypothetical protein
MATKGVFGYIIGKKKRMMKVEDDADLLWQILVREIYVLMKHYKTKECLQEAFSLIKVYKTNFKGFKPEELDRMKYYTDYTKDDINLIENRLRYCQSSYINLLNAGYIDNQTEEYGHIFMLDFNKGSVRYYKKLHDGKLEEIDTEKIEELMKFEDMPLKTYEEIMTDMKDRFDIYYEKLLKIDEEISKLVHLKDNSKKQGAANIEEKVDKLLYDMKWERKLLNIKRREFYYRLKVLDLIEGPE